MKLNHIKKKYITYISNLSVLFFLTFPSKVSVEDRFCPTGAAVSGITGCSTRKSTSLFSTFASTGSENTTLFIAALSLILNITLLPVSYDLVVCSLPS